jgi:hypothetical protein
MENAFSFILLYGYINIPSWQAYRSYLLVPSLYLDCCSTKGITSDCACLIYENHGKVSPSWRFVPTGLNNSVHVINFINVRLTKAIRGSAVSYWLTAARPRGRSSSPDRVNNFHFSISSIPALGSIRLPIQCVPGTIFLRLKRQGCETDHSLPNSAFMAKSLIIEARGQLYLFYG